MHLGVFVLPLAVVWLSPREAGRISVHCALRLNEYDQQKQEGALTFRPSSSSSLVVVGGWGGVGG